MGHSHKGLGERALRDEGILEASLPFREWYRKGTRREASVSPAGEKGERIQKQAAKSFIAVMLTLSTFLPNSLHLQKQ